MSFRQNKQDKTDKILSIGIKIMLLMTSVSVAALVIVGYVTFSKVSYVQEKNYDDKIENVMAVTDKAIDTYLKNIESITETFAGIDLIKLDDDSITSYVDKSDPSGKVKMVYENFSEYEKQVYNLEKIFVEKNDGIIGISVALESNGAFVRYPEEPRSNNYDSRVRSWYKSAKAKNGKVNISDAYVASAGYRAIVCSLYFNDINGKPRGVISVDVNIDYFEELVSATFDKNSNENEYYIFVDKNGQVIVNYFDKSTEFKKIQECGIDVLKDYKHGDDKWYTTVLDNEPYEIWTWPSNSAYFEGDYLVCIPERVVYKSDNAVLYTVVAGVILAALFNLVLSFFMGKKIVQPLKYTVNMLKDISEGEGDLTQRLELRGNDETTLLAKYFNKTFEKINNTVKSILGETHVMTSVASDLSHDMAETASAINEISSNVSSIQGEVINQSAGVEETSATIQQISENITKLKNNIDEQVTSVSQSSSAIEQMVANIRSVTDVLDKNSKSVNDLASSAENGRTVLNKVVELIDKIVSDSEGLMEASTVIQNIASQTNLLAMNAAIEAAHAGDVGKGFSVVADEIRKLAVDSSAQGKRISDALIELKDLISSVASSSKEIQSQFNLIFENTQKVNQQESVIKSAMDEQNAGSQQILNAMHDITNITDEVKQGAEIMERGGKEIIVEMNKLASVTQEISGSMNEMTTGISDINNAMQRVNNKATENSDSIGRVSSELNKFKV